jgi:hypothetical protein
MSVKQTLNFRETNFVLSLAKLFLGVLEGARSERSELGTKLVHGVPKPAVLPVKVSY